MIYLLLIFLFVALIVLAISLSTKSSRNVVKNIITKSVDNKKKVIVLTEQLIDSIKIFYTNFIVIAKTKDYDKLSKICTKEMIQQIDFDQLVWPIVPIDVKKILQKGNIIRVEIFSRTNNSTLLDRLDIQFNKQNKMLLVNIVEE